MGTLFLVVCYFRLCLCHFTAIRHLGFEMAIWYWHFVDVVWILVFISIYWWGNSSVNFDNIYNTFEEVVATSTFVDYSDTSIIISNVNNLFERMHYISKAETNELIESVVMNYYTGEKIRPFDLKYYILEKEVDSLTKLMLVDSMARSVQSNAWLVLDLGFGISDYTAPLDNKVKLALDILNNKVNNITLDYNKLKSMTYLDEKVNLALDKLRNNFDSPTYLDEKVKSAKSKINFADFNFLNLAHTENIDEIKLALIDNSDTIKLLNLFRLLDKAGLDIYSYNVDFILSLIESDLGIIKFEFDLDNLSKFI